jgi:hypothetical protein
LYTAVDISDLYDDKSKIWGNKFPGGTSYAAPRLSCYISSVISKYNVKAITVIRAIRNIIYNSPDVTITQEDIEEEVKK